MQQARVTLAGVSVLVSTPPRKPTNVTFLLPGAMIAISEYDSIRNVLVKRNHAVLSFYCNVLTTRHRVMATWVQDIFNEFKRQKHIDVDCYNIVGHSVGGKIALLVATDIDVERVSTAIALDPIDMNPAEFTSGNVKLSQANASLYITWATAGGAGITECNNPRAVYESDPSAFTSFVEFQDAGHMAYTDNGGGLPGLLMRSGSKEGNKRAHAGTLELVERLFGGQ